MAGQKRVTVYLDPDLHTALRLKGAELDIPVSDLINTAVRNMLAEDATDLESFQQRGGEPALAFEGVLRELRRRGKL